MRPEKTTYRPINFIDRIEGNNHIVLLYDDQSMQILLLLGIIQMTLKKESHVFSSSSAATSEEPDTIEKMLSAQCIDFHSYNWKNSLRIYHVESPDKDNNNEIEILDTLKTIRKEATIDMKPPYRFVGRTISDTETMEGMKWDWL
jgi:hypothetical protein